MKITVYTIPTCQFSLQEKEYLVSHKLPFEEKNIESNREFLTEMLAVGNNFAGTPITKMEKDDGKIEVLKGFTKEDFDKVLGFEEKSVEEKKEEPVIQTTPPQPAPEPAEAVAPETPKQEVVPPAPAQAQNDPLASVLDTLQAQVNEVSSSPPPATVPITHQEPPLPPPTVVSGQQTIPDPKF